MDALVIVLLGLVFCLKSASKPDTIEEIVETQLTEIAALETKLNESFYEDEHAFEVVSNGLNFH